MGTEAWRLAGVMNQLAAGLAQALKGVKFEGVSHGPVDTDDAVVEIKDANGVRH